MALTQRQQRAGCNAQTSSTRVARTLTTKVVAAHGVSKVRMLGFII